MNSTVAQPDSYKALLEQRAALDKQIEGIRSAARNEAIATCRAQIAEFNLTEADLFTTRKVNRTSGMPVPAKYKDPATGATWTGRGKAPKWIDNQDRTKFLIDGA